MYLAEKDGKQFRVSGVQVAAFRNAGYTITGEAKTKARAKTKNKAEAKAQAEAETAGVAEAAGETE